MWILPSLIADTVDQLTTVTPAARSLKALEAAANGSSIMRRDFWDAGSWQVHTMTDWRHHGATTYHPTVPQILAYSVGFTPIEATLQSAERAAFQRIIDEAKGKADVVLAEAVRLWRAGRDTDADKLIEQAQAEGLNISEDQIENAQMGVHAPAGVRDMRRTPNRLREERGQRLENLGKILGEEQ